MKLRLRKLFFVFSDYARLFRLPNLWIVFIAQYLLQYLLIIPAFQSASIPPQLLGFHFFLLVFSTILIAAGGYVLNDIEDIETDLLNKAGRVVVGRKLTLRQAWVLYFSIFLSGFFISLYLANYVENTGLVLLYPGSAALLWWYSKTGKKKPFWGNFVVSVFCAFVPGIVWFAERKGFAELAVADTFLEEKLRFLLTGYLVFAFLSTLTREIVKDLEDLEGDRLTGCRTLPVVFGVKNAQIAAFFSGLLLLAALIPFYRWLSQHQKITGFVFCTAGIFLPLVWILRAIITAKVKRHFTQISRWLKILMIAGLILLIIVWKF
jgi:4-hydroxybenzoate polyprenyltransferase